MLKRTQTQRVSMSIGPISNEIRDVAVSGFAESEQT